VKTFALQIQEPADSRRITGVRTFIGEDASGSFGIRAGHERLMTILVFGLARFMLEGGAWQYLAMPGALLYFADNTLILNARRVVTDSDYERISATLQEQLAADEEALHGIKESLRRMEEEMLKRLWQMGRGQKRG
jgi:F-type H+-transporting ATPase subunit epsilon